MQNLVRSKTMGVTGNGGRGTAGAGPGRDLLYPMEHKMVDMSILLRAGATVQAVDKSGKPQEDT